MVVKNVDPNVVFTVDKLREKHNDLFLFGDIVRALTSNCSTLYDEHDIITNDMGILYTLPLAAKQRTWTIRDNTDRPQYQKDKAYGSLYLVSAFFDEDIDEIDEPSSDSYLTPRDLVFLKEKGVDIESKHKMSLRNLFVENTDDRMVPEKAIAIFKYQYYGMNFRIHITENPKEYVFELHDKYNTFPANKCIMAPSLNNGEVTGLNPNEVDALLTLNLSGYKPLPEKEKQKYLELTKTGWTDNDRALAAPKFQFKKVSLFA